MSGAANPLLQTTADTAPVAQAIPPVASPDVNRGLISRALRGSTQEQMLRRRDAAGGELAILTKVMNDKNPNRKEVSAYIGKLVAAGHMPAETAIKIIASLPDGGDALRSWARNVFSMVMHQGIHAHAAFPRSIFPSPGAPPAPDVPTNQ